MKSKEPKYRWLIHFSADDWWISNPHSRHHITNEFYNKGFKILWVNPMGLRFPSFKKNNFKKKLLNKFKSFGKYLKKIDRSFYVFTFFFLPIFKRGIFEKLNRQIIGVQFKIVTKFLGITNPTAFVTLPTFAPIVRDQKKNDFWEKIIYYYSDQYERYREIEDNKPIIEWDNMLKVDSDAIYCASEHIYNTIPSQVKKSKIVRVLDHQVDFHLFDWKRVLPREIHIDKPIIGYFGSLTDSNDWDIIRYCAVNKPQWNFVFIGKKNIQLPELEELENVYFLGMIPYKKLPAVAANFDVGIMFWKLTDWIKACSPLKLKEYLALGLPIVSVPIDEVLLKYTEYVQVATDGPSFVAAIEQVLTLADRNERREFAMQYSWANLVWDIVCELDLS